MSDDSSYRPHRHVFESPEQEVTTEEIRSLVARKAEHLTRLRHSLPYLWPDLIADLLIQAGDIASRAKQPRVLELVAFEAAMELQTYVPSGSAVSGFVESLFDIAYETRGSDAAAIRERLLRAVRGWLGAMTSGDLVDSVQVRRTSEFIRTHLADKLTCQTLSKVSGWSSHYLDGVFRRAFGMSLHDYIVRMRIQRAIELLLSGQKVSAVITDVGYRNKTSFNRAFHGITGTTPGRFRRWASDRRRLMATNSTNGKALAGIASADDDSEQLRTLFERMRT